MRREYDAKLIGTSPEMTDLRDEIGRVSSSNAKVLITGESGVGKELVARAIHAGSPRAKQPFVALNCAGLPETLLESELFGHVKGSFTGAYRDKAGKFEVADGGTVFLDEIGEMSLRMQGLLLRFLETGELQKVGAERAVPARVNVRVIAATNRDLRSLIEAGSFREDLFYRLNVIHLLVPPLRERRADIAPLVEHFLAVLSRQTGEPLKRVAPDTMKALSDYAWPGNVRELENVVERIAIRVAGEVVTLADLPSDFQSPQRVRLQPARERRRTIADELYQRLREEQASFWTIVYPLYMRREITRGNIRDLVRKGLEETRGNYRMVARLFNTQPGEYKKFLNFLRKHDCQLPFKEYRH